MPVRPLNTICCQSPVFWSQQCKAARKALLFQVCVDYGCVLTTCRESLQLAAEEMQLQGHTLKPSILLFWGLGTLDAVRKRCNRNPRVYTVEIITSEWK